MASLDRDDQQAPTVSNVVGFYRASFHGAEHVVLMLSSSLGTFPWNTSRWATGRKEQIRISSAPQQPICCSRHSRRVPMCAILSSNGSTSVGGSHNLPPVLHDMHVRFEEMARAVGQRVSVWHDMVLSLGSTTGYVKPRMCGISDGNRRSSSNNNASNNNNNNKQQKQRRQRQRRRRQES